MNRSLAAIGLAVVVAAGIAFYLLRRSDDAAPAPGTAVGVAPSDNPPPAPQRTATPVPSLPSVGSGEKQQDGSGTYSVGGVAITDHRSGEPVPMELTPNLHAPDSRRLPSTAVAEITGKVKAALYRCAAAVPREARGNQPKLDGQFTVSIKQHVLTIDAAAARIQDVVGAALEPTQQCVEKASIGLSIDTPDEADLTSYVISVSYLIP